MRTPSRVAALSTVITTVITIAAGALLWHHLPAGTDIYAPFDVHGKMGQRVAGRNLTATIESTVITPRLLVSSGKVIPAIGTWIAVGGGFDTDTGYALAHADLLVGPNRYAPTDRLVQPPPLLQPGITDERAFVFDVAPDVLDNVASVVFRIWLGDGRLDTRLVVEVPLDDHRVQRVSSLHVRVPQQDAR